MKKLLIIGILISNSFFGLAKESLNPLMSSKTVVWAGLDYSKVRLIGGDNSEYDFRIPDLIYPRMLVAWNELFLDERAERVAYVLGKTLDVDIGGVTERNRTATSSQIILNPGPKDTIEESHITKQDIADEVRSYKMEKTNGMGLVFMVDGLVARVIHETRRSADTSPVAHGAIYMVLFDIATREIIIANREICASSNAANFRNCWFGPIKDADKSLGKYRVSK